MLWLSNKSIITWIDKATTALERIEVFSKQITLHSNSVYVAAQVSDQLSFAPNKRLTWTNGHRLRSDAVMAKDSWRLAMHLKWLAKLLVQLVACSCELISISVDTTNVFYWTKALRLLAVLTAAYRV